MRALARWAVVAGLVLGFAAVSFAGLAHARPAGEFPLFLALNGEPRRWQMPDAGWSGTYGSGVSCVYVQTGNALGCSVLKLTPPAKIHVCMGQVGGGSAWDGGCVTTATDPNYGDPAAADTPYFLTLQTGTTQVCTVPATGSASTPFFCMQ